MGFRNASRFSKDCYNECYQMLFSKSTKLIKSFRCHTVHCLMIFRRAKIWSIQPFPFLNTACSSLNLLSTTLLNLFMIILARILLGMESRVIPRQLLQSFNAPFFGILIMVASFQSSGILLSSQNFIMRVRRISAAMAGSVLKSSALRLSGPAAL